jgi:hypothetical protein
MQVEMKHRLPRAEAIVDNGPVPIGEFAVFGNFRGNQLQVSKSKRVLSGGIGE